MVARVTRYFSLLPPGSERTVPTAKAAETGKGDVNVKTHHRTESRPDRLRRSVQSHVVIT